MTLALRAAAALALLCASCLGRGPAQAPAEPRYQAIALEGVMIPMRDGVRLRTDVHLPGRDGLVVPGRFPVVLERTPYGRASASLRPWIDEFVAAGYAVVRQDVRGRFGSEGRWRPHRDDGNDGYDTLAWITAQLWSDGKVGTVGTSYAGGTQHALALANPPALVAMVPIDAMSNCGRYGIRHHGAFELRFLNWILTLGNPWLNSKLPPGVATPEPFYPSDDPAARLELAKLASQVREISRALPLPRGATALRLAPDYESWLLEAMSHGDYDAFWKDMGSSVVDHLPEYKDVPVLHVSGWYDSWGTPVANMNYVELSKSKQSPQHLWMGPWIHGGQSSSFAGEAEFGPEAAIDRNALQLRWFDRWLRGIDNGVDLEPPVRIFVMGGGDGHRTPEGRVFVGGHWRDEQEWPLARAVPTPYYLHAGGLLSPEPPTASPPARFRFDPRDPVPTIGGNLSSQGPLANAGAANQRCRTGLWTCRDTRRLAERPDVLVFQTPPLERDVEVTGRLIVRLWGSSSARDTDFTAKLVDVWPPNVDFPAGVELNVADGIVRARYRASLERATMMKPGTVHPFEVEMYPTSLVFARGHRIRLDVSSSNFPRFDVNPNTGEPLNGNRRWAVAENRVYFDPQHPSHVLLPVVPASSPD